MRLNQDAVTIEHQTDSDGVATALVTFRSAPVYPHSSSSIILRFPMSYDLLERSNYASIPVNLYEFSLGYSFWRYASSDRDVTIAGMEYVGVFFDTGSSDLQSLSRF